MSALVGGRKRSWAIRGFAWAIFCLLTGGSAASSQSSSDYQQARNKFEQCSHFEALLSARRAAEAEPENADYQLLLGRVLSALQQFTSAEKSFREAVALAPDRSEVHYWLASALVGLGKDLEAIAALKRTVELDPGHSRARMHIGRLYYKLELDDNIALEQFGIVAEQDPAYPWVHYHLAVLDMNRGEEEKGLREYQLEIQHHPDHTLAHVELGELLLKKDQPDEALNHLLIAEKQDPSLPSIYCALATAYHEIGELEKGILAARKNLELSPESYQTHYVLGQLYRDKGELQQARQEFRIFKDLKAKAGEQRYRTR